MHYISGVSIGTHGLLLLARSDNWQPRCLLNSNLQLILCMHIADHGETIYLLW